MNRYRELSEIIEGEVYTDATMRHLYSTDASVYREMPGAVIFPRTVDDLGKIMQWAGKHNMPLIPRTAGTSLAGQVVGSGAVVDTGRYLREVQEINTEDRYVWVEPGVIRDDLNKRLSEYGLQFAPETSTSNRCMIAGMVGNNACGARSLIYGSTRDHLLEVKGFLSDGTPVHFKPLDGDELEEKLGLPGREGEVYRFIFQHLDNPETRKMLAENTPWPDINRRNTGYALDLLALAKPWEPTGEKLNLSQLIAGSEGTLMMISAIKLNLVPLPPPCKLLLCVHFRSLQEAFAGNLVILRYQVSSIELIDDTVLACTADHIGMKQNRFFLSGNPKAVLIIEIEGDSMEEVHKISRDITAALKQHGYGYHYPEVTGTGIGKVWELRKAGLGLLSNLKGAAKPVPVVEDAAVRPADLERYMHDIALMLEKHGLQCVYYAHIATGELHLRPVLNLKNPQDVHKFRLVAEETAQLVKKYRGSLSGEHGDGRLRGEFIPVMTGQEVYGLYQQLKRAFDPSSLLNPGKITDTPPMDTSLRYEMPYLMPNLDTVFDFTTDGSLQQALERCNGSGDCRRPYHYNSIMCPSYQASLDERMSTRGRANLLREMLSKYPNNPLGQPAVKEVLDHCLSCKGCKLECPSTIDMARYKAEALHQYYRRNKRPLKVTLAANVHNLFVPFTPFPKLFNQLTALKPVESLLKAMAGIHPKRHLPKLSEPPLRSAFNKYNKEWTTRKTPGVQSVLFLIDEFTRSFDATPAIKAMQLLHHLGFAVEPVWNCVTGRASISNGNLVKARKLANRNVSLIAERINGNTPLVGLEPSALLTFVDEYPDLVSPHLKEEAEIVKRNVLLIEDFIDLAHKRGDIGTNLFTTDHQHIVLHGHCHQKVLSNTGALKRILSLPENYKVEELPTGCCGMAGFFGMEKQHYDLSMKIGEQILFPKVRNMTDGMILAMAGTSCRQQVLDGTGVKALHPAEILFNALKKTST